MDSTFLRSRARRALAFLAGVPILVAACGTGSGATATIPADATGSLQPPVSSTPVPSNPPAFPVSLTGYDDVSVEIGAEPERIVSLTPAVTETLFALGVGDRVVGKVEDFALYPPEAASIPDVARYGEVDVERIVALEADLVIAGGNDFNPRDKIDQLRDLGLPVLVLYAPDVAAVLADIEAIGAAVGRAGAAKDLAASMRAAFDQVGAATSGLDRPRVFYELDATREIYTAADDSFLAEMIELAGGDPVTTGSSTKFDIPLESLVTADPEVILLGDAAYGVTADQVAARPGWSVMSAVRAGEIRPIDDIVVTRPGPRLVQGLLALAAAIHPEAILPSPAPVPAAP